MNVFKRQYVRLVEEPLRLPRPVSELSPDVLWDTQQALLAWLGWATACAHALQDEGDADTDQRSGALDAEHADRVRDQRRETEACAQLEGARWRASLRTLVGLQTGARGRALEDVLATLVGSEGWAP